MDRKKILVTGATGMLGSTIVPYLREQGHTVLTHGCSSVADYPADLTNLHETLDLIRTTQPEVIINLVGHTSVEDCEENLQQAYRINTLTVENIAASIRQIIPSAHLVHISTDHIYDGDGIHDEEHIRITNNYAITKYAGELAASLVDATILRTNFIGRSRCANRQSLTDWVYQSLKASESIKVLSDVTFSPLSMQTLSYMIHLVVLKKTPGVFNLGAKNGMSKADLDIMFAEEVGLPTDLMTKIEAAKATFIRAYRPKNMMMNSTRFEETFKVVLPELEQEIKLVAREYHE